MGSVPLEISLCREADRAKALALALKTLPASQRTQLVDSLKNLENEPLGAFDALFTGKRGRRVVAASWGQPQPGRTASLWLPEATEGLSKQEATELVHRVMRAADERGVSMTQVLLETDQHPQVEPLIRNGFEKVAALQYMEWTKESGRGIGASSSGVTFEPRASENPERLHELVQATYIDTLDCPALEGVRDLGDSIAGYKQVGRFDPELWCFVRRHGRDAGVLLLAEHPATRQLELVYMGISPEARGQGLGACAVSKAQQVAVERDVDRLVLAVDAANLPAKQHYFSAGFVEWAARVVYVRRRNAQPLSPAC